DAIVLASGFGTEVALPDGVTPSYWRNDTLGQPALNGAKQTYLVSGFGDGAIVDLCRLTIERFRQGRILNDIWGPDVHKVEELLRGIGITNVADGATLKKMHKESGAFSEIVSFISARLKPR